MKRPRQPGLVVLDTNCFKYFTDQGTRERVLRSLRAVDLQIRPTAINILQLTFTPASASRSARFEAVKAIAGTNLILPWPYDLLRRVGEAIQKTESGFYTGPSGLEWVVDQLPVVTDPSVLKAQATVKSMDAAFDEAHITGRPVVQRFLKERGLRDGWRSVQDFLDQQWTRPQQVDTLVEAIWGRIGLRGKAPVEEILQSESWRLLVEGFGATLFERAVNKNQRARVELTDVLQLVYLGGTQRRIFVTEDRAFLATATAIVNGRYPGAHVYSWEEFLSKHF